MPFQNPLRNADRHGNPKSPTVLPSNFAMIHDANKTTPNRVASPLNKTSGSKGFCGTLRRAMVRLIAPIPKRKNGADREEHEHTPHSTQAARPPENRAIRGSAAAGRTATLAQRRPRAEKATFFRFGLIGVTLCRRTRLNSLLPRNACALGKEYKLGASSATPFPDIAHALRQTVSPTDCRHKLCNTYRKRFVVHWRVVFRGAQQETVEVPIVSAKYARRCRDATRRNSDKARLPGTGWRGRNRNLSGACGHRRSRGRRIKSSWSIKKYRPALETTKASAIILGRDAGPSRIAALRSQNPYLDFARAIELFNEAPAYAPGVHPTAIISGFAKIGSRAHIGPYCFVDDDVEIGANAVLHSFVAIYRGARIGDNFFAHRAFMRGARNAASAIGCCYKMGS